MILEDREEALKSLILDDLDGVRDEAEGLLSLFVLTGVLSTGVCGLDITF